MIAPVMAYDDYVHEAGRTSADRRRRRAVITMTVVFALLLSAFGIALAFNQGWVGDRKPWGQAGPTCTPWTEPPPPKDITVNVYNSTDTKGLAAKAAADLAAQEFRIEGVGNDPLKKKVAGVAEIRYGKQTAAQAKVLAQRFPGAKMLPDQSTDGILDVALGEKFTKVANPKPPVAPSNPC